MKASLTKRGAQWVAAWVVGEVRCEYACADRMRAAAFIAELTGVVLSRPVEVPHVH